MAQGTQGYRKEERGKRRGKTEVRYQRSEGRGTMDEETDEDDRGQREWRGKRLKAKGSGQMAQGTQGYRKEKRE